jgi:small-conductance mechanosensitive channel
MSFSPRHGWHCALLCLLVAIVCCGRTLADGPAFPSTWLRWAQKPEPPASAPAANGSETHADVPTGAEAVAHDEQQAAALNLLAANLADAEERRKAHLQEKADWQAKLEKLATERLSEPQPYSFLALDKARDELATEKQNAGAITDAVARAKQTVAHAAEGQDERERDLRRAKDELEHNRDASAITALTQAVADAEHELTAAGQLLALRRAELANLQLDQQVQSLRQQFAESLVELYEQDAVFTPAMRNDVLTELDARGKAASARAKQLTDDLSKFLQPQWYQARERLDNARATEDEAKLAALAAEVQAKDLAQQLADYEIGINVTKFDRIGDLHTAWQRRYALANSLNSAVEAAQWLDETKAANERLRVDTATLHAQAESVQKQLDAVEKKLQAADKSDTSLRYWLGKTSQSLEQQRRLCEKSLAELEPARRLLEKLEDDLTGDTISATAARWITEGRKDLELVWDYEVANVQERPITVGRIVKGLFFFALGLFASRLLSRAFGRRLLSRMGVNASASAAFQSLAYYLLVLLFTLFALKQIEVPLTAFTVLGGAVALGVGFGSQNIVNNFISGLILLVERPVKVGDLIQISNLYGNVEHIGARSTRVKTGENLDIIVPNSTFLETNVVNWTLSDNNMRTHVAFGVMYGSPTGKLTHLALKAAANHDRVFDRPAPFVIFIDFGESALQFELHFWVSVRTLMERRTIESDIRFNIEHLFREAGIVMAYPQRDVHLHTEQPLQVQMTPAGQGDSDAA